MSPNSYVVIKVRKSGGASDAGSYTYAGEYPTENEYFLRGSDESGAVWFERSYEENVRA